jgi:pyruvate/2-oxoglutarate dehydrogenase complex dihydrolipoamide dehydrogenase (E3) component
VSDRYDVAIIGAGSGGVVAANFAARAGARVVLIEKHRIGGDCTWTGCVPSKALLKAAKVAHLARTASHYGVSASLEPVNLKAVMDYVRSSIANVYQFESPEVLQHEGVDVLMGQARFTDAHTISVATQNGPVAVKAKNFIICTGGRPTIPRIEGLADVPYLTYETVFDMEVLPRHLLVMGGGPIGIEMTQAFSRLGAEVSVFQRQPRLIPKDEPEAAEVLQKVLSEEGVKLHLNTRATAVAKKNGQLVLTTDKGDFMGDALLIAVGRTPNVDTMDLEKAGVTFTAKGVPVNDTLETNVKHIYAAGDVIGGPQFTHYAGYQAFQATRNALFPGSSKGIVQCVPWSTFTDPR